MIAEIKRSPSEKVPPSEEARNGGWKRVGANLEKAVVGILQGNDKPGHPEKLDRAEEVLDAILNDPGLQTGIPSEIEAQARVAARMTASPRQTPPEISSEMPLSPELAKKLEIRQLETLHRQVQDFIDGTGLVTRGDAIYMQPQNSKIRFRHKLARLLNETSKDDPGRSLLVGWLGGTYKGKSSESRPLETIGKLNVYGVENLDRMKILAEEINIKFGLEIKVILESEHSRPGPVLGKTAKEDKL